MALLLAFTVILGMMVPILIFPLVKNIPMSKLQLFITCGGAGSIVAFFISYAAYLHFFVS